MFTFIHHQSKTQCLINSRLRWHVPVKIDKLLFPLFRTQILISYSLQKETRWLLKDVKACKRYEETDRGDWLVIGLGSSEMTLLEYSEDCGSQEHSLWAPLLFYFPLISFYELSTFFFYSSITIRGLMNSTVASLCCIFISAMKDELSPFLSQQLYLLISTALTQVSHPLMGFP